MAFGYKDSIDLIIYTLDNEIVIKSGQILEGDMNYDEFSDNSQAIYNNPKYIERLQDGILEVINSSDYVWLFENEKVKIKTEDIERVSLILSNDLKSGKL